MKTVRCAIYTRKSSDEGLEQDFNSLDAQREACTAYVLSQASEGWKLLPQQYDDGGLSGGTLERPALQQLLSHIREGRIDIIVVYKVDRLTRSLLDFARLVEAFDEAEVSFVSVTQSFNTTTSMGRLTLNMLLSFAQFEREVTAERIRDKIAASKAKGMWMGGTPPLGYKPDGRSLAIVEDHAAIVRDIYDRYRKLGNVRLVAEQLADAGIETPRRVNGKGRAYGGCAFTRGQLYTILKNPVYAGDIAHKDKLYPGNHPAIIERDVWNAAQQRLADHVKGVRKAREASASLLAGVLFDAAGEPLVPVHASKKKQRYRYYVSRAHQHGTADPASAALRLPAREIENVVRQELAHLLSDPMALAHKSGIALSPATLEALCAGCRQLAAKIEAGARQAIRPLLARVTVHPERLDLDLSVSQLARLVAADLGQETAETICHTARVRLTRSGHSLKLIHRSGAPARQLPDQTCIRLVIKARAWWSELAQGAIDIASLARREQVTPSYLTRVVRLAFLGPNIVAAILEGQLRAPIDGTTLLATGAIDPDWREQARSLLPAHGQELQA